MRVIKPKPSAARGQPKPNPPPKATPIDADRADNPRRPRAETGQEETGGGVRKGRTGAGNRGLGLAARQVRSRATAANRPRWTRAATRHHRLTPAG